MFVTKSLNKSQYTLVSIFCVISTNYKFRGKKCIFFCYKAKSKDHEEKKEQKKLQSQKESS